MSNIFISHSSKDNDFAQKIIVFLKGIGHKSIFLDFDPDDGIPAGRNWEKELYRNLGKCKLVIVLFSKNFSTSRWCFAEITQARALGKFIIPVKISDCTADSILSDVQMIDATIDLSRAFELLEKGLLNAGIKKEVWDNTRPPYPGLFAFEEEDAPVFFGRVEESDDVLNKIRAYQRIGGPKLLLIIGASGTGKSSLLRAGLIPQLRREKRSWIIVGPFRPQKKPFKELSDFLARAFGAQAGRTQTEIYNLLIEDLVNNDSGNCVLSDLLTELIEASQHENVTALLCIDQVEELLVYGNTQDVTEGNTKDLFLSYLRRFLNVAGNKFLIIGTLRSDFLKNFQENENLKDLHFDDYIIKHINPEGLKATIVEPAVLAGIEFESGLVDIIIKDTGTSDALPLLAFTLRELWDQYGKDQMLEIDEYQNKLGGLEGSVAKVAEAVLSAHIAETQRGEMVRAENQEKRANLDTEDENNLKAAFMAMVRIDEEGRYSKRFADWKELPIQITDLLEKFVTKRLLTSSGNEKDIKIEVAHEALFRIWKRLANWLEEEKSFLIWRKRLGLAVEDWNRTGKDDSELLRGPALAEALEWFHQYQSKKYFLTIEEIEFIKVADEKDKAEKIREAERRLELEEKNRQLELALKEAKEQTLQARAKALAATAREKLQTDATMALRLAEAACKITPVASREAQSAFVDILSQNLAFYKKSFEGHLDRVDSVAFSPNGKFILTGSWDKTAKLWSMDGTLLRSFEGHTNIVDSVAFSPDGKFILTGSWDKTAKLWSMDGTLLQSFEGHTNMVNSVAFSLNGKSILTGSDDETARLWDLDGTLKQSFEGHEGHVNSVAFSPSGKSILTGNEGYDSQIKLWNIDGTLKQSFGGCGNGHGGIGVYSVAFSPDGKLLITAGDDSTAKLWDLKGTLKQSFEGHTGLVYSVRFSPDGKQILTGSWDHTARLWNMDGTLKQLFEGCATEINSVAFSPDANCIVTGNRDKTAKLWNLHCTLKQSFDTLKVNDIGRIAALSPDGKYILTGDGDKTLKLFNWNGILKQSFEEQIDRIASVAFSPDGQYIFTGGWDKTAKLWNLDGTLKQSFEGLTDRVSSVAFFPDGKCLLTRCKDDVIFWNLNGTLKQSFGRFPVVDFSVAFSPDGKYILTSWYKTAKLYDLAGTLKQSFEGHKNWISSVAFSPDGKCILTGSEDETAKLWNLDGTLKQSFEGHKGSVSSVAFSPNGKWILTGSKDRTAKFWKLNGTQMQSFDGHTHEIELVAFSPDGKYLLTGTIFEARMWRPYWEILDPENTYVPTSKQMKEFDIPADMHWGKIW